MQCKNDDILDLDGKKKYGHLNFKEEKLDYLIAEIC